MNKRVAAWLVSTVILLTLGGCQLAVEGKGTTANPDALRGMFITFGSSFAADNTALTDEMIDSWVSGVTQIPDRASAGQRVYATMQPDEYGGMQYVFSGIEGVPMFEPLIHGNGDNSDYWASCFDNSLLDVMTTVGGMGSGSSIKIEGTLTLTLNTELCDEYGQCILYLNPVYQNEDGEVYMLPAGSGVALFGQNAEDGTALMSVGNLGKFTISNSTTMTSGQKKESWSGEFSVTVMGIGDIQRYVLKEMDANDRLIVSKEITEGNIPGTLTLNDKTAYAILEEYSEGEDGGTHVNRSLVDMSAEFFTVRFPDQKGLARQTLVTINNRPD